MEFRDERRTAVIIASGPSAGEADLSLCKGWPVVVVNDCFRLYPDADLLYACDRQWWDIHQRDTQGFAGERWTQCAETAQKYGLSHIAGEPGAGFSSRRGLIFYNWNSGAQAMQLAWQMGARRLILIGFDCGKIKDKVHWFGDHPRGLVNESPWQMFIGAFELMAKDCEKLGIEVINTSMGSLLRCFPRRPLAEVL